MKYEVWGYSRSLRRWVRKIYPTLDLAEARYRHLQNIKRSARPPQRLGTGIPFVYHWVAFADRFIFPPQKEY